MAIDIAKAHALVTSYDELTATLADPAVIADTERYTRLMKDLSDLASKAETVRAWEEALKEKEEALELLSGGDEEIRELATEQLSRAKADIERYEKEIVLMLTPRDERDDRSVILEIRAGTGGEEAALLPRRSSRCIKATLPVTDTKSPCWIPVPRNLADIRNLSAR
jgi:Protein chain release factor A